MRTPHAAMPPDSAHRRPTPFGRKLATTAVVTALIGATNIYCADESTGPSVEMCPSAPVPLCSADPAIKIAAQDGASDAAIRSAPALENAGLRSAISAALGQLNDAVGRGNITAARAALTTSREAIATGRTQLNSFPGDAADLAAIELLLDQVALLVGVS